MRPNHHQFIAFAHVVREGSFSAAAQQLGVTQSTITQHVAKLERAVGAQLLWRQRDGVEVTSTGRSLYDLADRLVAVDAALGERLAGFSSMEDGRIKVIANAPQPALRIISAFSQEFPGIQIDFGLFDWSTANAMIKNKLADVGLITDPPTSDECERYFLQETQYAAYCRADHPLALNKGPTLAEIAEHVLVLPEKGSLTLKILKGRFLELGITPSRTVNMTTFPVMCEAVLQGVGVAIFLRNSSLIRDGLVELAISDLSENYKTWLVTPRDRSSLRLISNFTRVAVSTSL